jgi:hypothetical protein
MPVSGGQGSGKFMPNDLENQDTSAEALLAREQLDELRKERHHVRNERWHRRLLRLLRRR